MRNLRVVIRREYVERVRSRWFIASTVGGPLLMAAVILLPMLMAVKDEQAGRRLALVDRTGVLVGPVARSLEQAGFLVEPVEPGDGIESALTVRTLERELEGYLVLDAETLESGRYLFRVREDPGTMRRLSVQNAVVRSVLEVRLEEAGSASGLQALLSGGEPRLDVLERRGVGQDEPAFLGAFVGAMILYFVILLYAQAVMRAVLEEKTSRVVEIVVSALSPWELMLGKVLGVGAVGLTQLAVWTASGAALVLVGVPALEAGPGTAALAGLRAALPGPGLLTLFLVMFLLGYFLYSAAYAAVGAMCSSDEEAQQAQFVVVLLLVVPVLSLMPVLNAPAATTSVALSLVPFFAPVLLYPRVAAGAAAGWQVGVAIALLVVAVLGVSWVAGRIYRVGILMQGKRPTLPELWKWVREA